MMRILVAGASGYVGSRLVPRLLEAGHQVRVLVRRASSLDRHPWHDRVQSTIGNVLDPPSLISAAAACDAAYYLVHQMDAGSRFSELDRIGAANFRDAAAASRLRRIVYLGGLGGGDANLSRHLKSRHEVGRILAAGPTPTTELRAGMIIGSGSLSFEMLRHLTEILPVMTTPRWVRTRCQPIAISDMLDLLITAAENPSTDSHTVEVGGPDVLTYQEMMLTYARIVGLRRFIIPVPMLTPRLSSLWVGLVTPLPVRVARPLIDTLRHEMVVQHDDTARLLRRDLLTFEAAVRRALGLLDEPPTPADTSAGPAPGDPAWSGGKVYVDRRVIPTNAAPQHVFWALSRIGGQVGYYGLNWAWRLRGFIDRLLGGTGFRRGRRHPQHLRAGDTIDFWRVEHISTDTSLRLRGEMRLPGEAWLQWDIEPSDEETNLVQTATFRPHGLAGRLYWWLMAPFHRYIFPRMACRMAAAAEERAYSCSY
jgi:uncharacterized protein YbjT (DUF2867 family)